MAVKTYLITGVCILSVIVGLTGNFIIIVVRIYKQYKRRNTTAYAFLISQLAAADFLFAFTLIFDIHSFLHQDMWLFGSGTCKFIKTLQSTSLSTTVGLLTVMAYERYCGISKPLQHRWSIKRTAITVAVIWFYIFLTLIPFMKALDVQEGKCYEVHHPSENFRKAYTMFMFVTNFVIPLISIVIFHTLMVVAMKKHKQTIGNSRQRSSYRESFAPKDGKSDGTEDNLSVIVELKRDQSCCRHYLHKLLKGKRREKVLQDKTSMLHGSKFSRKSSRRRNASAQRKDDHKLVKMLVAVTLCFVVMTLPTQIFYIWYDFSGEEASSAAMKILEVFASLVYIHCCANCIIYSAMDKRFRTDVKNMFRFIFKLQKPRRKWTPSGKKALLVLSRFSTKKSTSSSRSTVTEIVPAEYVVCEVQTTV